MPIFYLGPFIQSVATEGALHEIYFSVTEYGMVESIEPPQTLAYPMSWFVYDVNSKQPVSCCVVLEAADKPLRRFNLRHIAGVKGFMPGERPIGSNRWQFIRTKDDATLNVGPIRAPAYISPERCFIPDEAQKEQIKAWYETQKTVGAQPTAKLSVITHQDTLIDTVFQEMKQIAQQHPAKFPLNDVQKNLVKEQLYAEWQILEHTAKNPEEYYQALRAIVQNKVDELTFLVSHSCQVQARVLRTYFRESAINTFEGKGKYEWQTTQEGVSYRSFRPGRFYLQAEGASRHISIADVYRYMTAVMALAAEKLRKILNKPEENVILLLCAPPPSTENIKIGDLSTRGSLVATELSAEAERQFSVLRMVLSVFVSRQFQIRYRGLSADHWHECLVALTAAELIGLITLSGEIVTGDYSRVSEAQNMADYFSAIFSEEYTRFSFDWRISLRTNIIPVLDFYLGLKWLSQPEKIAEGKEWLCSLQQAISWGDYLENKRISPHELTGIFLSLLSLWPKKEEIIIFLSHLDKEKFEQIITDEYHTSLNILMTFFSLEILLRLSLEKVKIIFSELKRIAPIWLEENLITLQLQHLNSDATEQIAIKNFLISKINIKTKHHRAVESILNYQPIRLYASGDGVTLNLPHLFELMPTIDSCVEILAALSQDNVVSFIRAIESKLLENTFSVGRVCKENFLNNKRTLPYLTELGDFGRILSFLEPDTLASVLNSLNRCLFYLMNIDVNFTDLLKPCTGQQRVLICKTLNSRYSLYPEQMMKNPELLFSESPDSKLAAECIKMIKSTSPHYSVAGYEELRMGKFLCLFEAKTIKEIYQQAFMQSYMDVLVCFNLIKHFNFEQKHAFLEQAELSEVAQLRETATHLKQMFLDIQSKKTVIDWGTDNPNWLSWVIGEISRINLGESTSCHSFLGDFFSCFQSDQQTVLIDFISKEQWGIVLQRNNMAFFLSRLHSQEVTLKKLFDKVGEHLITLWHPDHLKRQLSIMTEEQKIFVLNGFSKTFMCELAHARPFEQRYPKYTRTIQPNSLANVRAIIVHMLQDGVQHRSTLTRLFLSCNSHYSDITFKKRLRTQAKKLLAWLIGSGQRCNASELKQQLIQTLLSISQRDAFQNGNAQLSEINKSNAIYKYLLYALKMTDNLQPSVELGFVSRAKI